MNKPPLEEKLKKLYQQNSIDVEEDNLAFIKNSELVIRKSNENNKLVGNVERLNDWSFNGRYLSFKIRKNQQLGFPEIIGDDNQRLFDSKFNETKKIKSLFKREIYFKNNNTLYGYSFNKKQIVFYELSGKTRPKIDLKNNIISKANKNELILTYNYDYRTEIGKIVNDEEIGTGIKGRFINWDSKGGSFIYNDKTVVHYDKNFKEISKTNLGFCLDNHIIPTILNGEDFIIFSDKKNIYITNEYFSSPEIIAEETKLTNVSLSHSNNFISYEIKVLENNSEVNKIRVINKNGKVIDNFKGKNHLWQPKYKPITK